MTNHTRRLIALELELDDARHDLDVADKEIAASQTIIAQQAAQIAALREALLEQLEQIEEVVWEFHEGGCPAIADDESDSVLSDYQRCACVTGEIRDAIRALAARKVGIAGSS